MRTYSSLLGRHVETQSGQAFGRCRDLRATLTRSDCRVTGIVVGTKGGLEHLGIERWKRDCVPWDAVVRIEGDRIVVRDGTELE